MPQALLPLIAALGVPGLVTATGTLTVLGQLIGAGLGVALTIGVNLLFAPRGPKPQDVKGVVRSSVAPRQKHYGQVRVGGHLMFIETIDGDLFQVVALGQGPINQYVTFYADDNELTLEGVTTGFATNEPYDGDSIEIDNKLGTASQDAFATLVQEASQWTVNHRLRGVAAVLCIARGVKQERVSEVYPNRIPVVNAVIRSVSVFDPRTSVTEFSTNLALCLRDYLVSADGARVDASLIDEASFSVAADICDEDVPIKAGGTIKRYHGGLTYSFDSEPKDVLERFLAAMDGRLYLNADGQIALLVGKWVEPTITLTDEHVLEFDFEDGAGPFRSANEIIVKFTHVEADYSEATADPWRNETSISEEGAVLSVAPEMYEIQHHNHARRMAKILERRAMPRWLGTIRTTLYGLRCFDQRWISLQVADLQIDETVEITKWTLDPGTMTVVMEVQSFAADAYDFNPATEEGTAPTVPEEPQETGIPAPAEVTLQARSETLGDVDTSYTDTDTIYDEVTGNETTQNEVIRATTVNAYVLVARVPDPPSQSLEVRFEYRRTSDQEWSPMDSNRGYFVGRSPPVSQGETYVARAQYRSFGSASGWTLSPEVTVPSA